MLHSTVAPGTVVTQVRRLPAGRPWQRARSGRFTEGSWLPGGADSVQKI